MRLVFTWLLPLVVLGCNGPPEQSLGVSVPPPGAVSPGARPFTEGIELSDSRFGLEHGIVSSRFNFGTLRELWIRVRVAGMPQVSMVNVKLIAPQGTVHYETNVAFSSSAAVESMEMPNGSHPIAVHLARAVPGGYEIDLPVPVAGTVLTRYLKSGSWQVTASVEGVPRTLSAPMEVFVSAN